MKKLSIGIVGCVLALGACDQNQSGNIGSTKVGDTSHPVERASPIAPLQEACNAEGLLLPGLATMINRRPYLQEVTTTSASFGWVSSSKGDEETIELTRPSGEMVMVAASSVEDVGALLASGERQMWTTAGQLEPDTIYCYRVLINGDSISERIGFRTAPTADSTRTIKVLAFGDSGGGGADQMALREQMEQVPYELIIHTGDLAYESGSIDQIEETVFGVYGDLFAHIPFMPSSGNHDYNTLSGAPYREVFKLPENGTDEKWYSYDWGRIHFASLDTEANYETQAKWLDDDLSASKAPWKIVYFHRPPYSSGNHGSDTRLRTILSPVLERHRVQLVLSGHDHHYERVNPVNGVNYIVTGGGGRGTYDVGSSSFTAFAEAVIHYVYFEVGTEELTLHAIDAEGKEFDSVVIPRV